MYDVVKPVKSNKLFLVLLFISFLFSLSLLFGNIDPDYYSSLYLGKRIVSGGDILTSAISNKGPVHRLIFALIYFVFGSRVIISQVVLSSLVDALTVFFILKIGNRAFDLKIYLRKIRGWFFLFFLVGVYKSFTIGHVYGGLNTESFPMLFVVLSIYLYLTGKVKTSALFFAFAVFTRLTSAFFMITIVLLSTSKDEFWTDVCNFVNFGKWGRLSKGIKKLLAFSLYLLMFSILILISIVVFSDWSSFLNDTVLFNLSYSKTVGSQKLYYLFGVLVSEPRLLVVLFFNVTALAALLVGKTKKDIKIVVTGLFISSLLATFVGGYFYYHHFYQFGLFFLVMVFSVTRYKLGRYIKLFFPVILLFTFLSYLQFVFAGFDYHPMNSCVDEIFEVNAKKYLIVGTYHPEIYINNNQLAPDKFFHPLQLLDSYNSSAMNYQSEHRETLKSVHGDIIFLFPSESVAQLNQAKEYKELFFAGYVQKLVGACGQRNKWQVEAYTIDR